jgi:5-methyltetrahydropteroyltriglutamate--homocysteine methyltransferase
MAPDSHRLAAGRIDQVSLECRNSQVSLIVLALLAGKEVLVGAIDVTTRTVETPEQVAAAIDDALKFVPVERLFPCTNCGMAPGSRDVAAAKLVAFGSGGGAGTPAPGCVADRLNAVRLKRSAPR